MTADELVAKAKEQRKRARFAEALVSAQQAISIDRQCAEAFWLAALCQIDLGCDAEAIAPLVEVVTLSPRFARAWTKLGLAYVECSENEHAKTSLETAIEIDSGQFDALEALAELYEQDDQPDKELEALTTLSSVRDLSAFQLNRLGILHHDAKNFYLAIRYYGQVAELSTGPAGFFNLGLAFHEPEVSQDVDAVDAWRRAIKRDPAYERAPKMIASVMPKLLALRRTVKAQSKPLLDQQQWYSWYVNPIELLRLDVDSSETPDPKTIQRARKALIQEIDLEQGRIEWMPSLSLDRSRAIGICEEMNDPAVALYHTLVFLNPPLSAFLQRGELDHFLVDEVQSPIELLEHIEEDKEGFGAWLSPLFTRQFDALLARAIEQRNVPAVECLLDGRRWVLAQDEDRCFDGAHRQVARLLDTLRDAVARSIATKPTHAAIKTLLTEASIAEILGLLPIAFHEEQYEAATHIRSISIATYNEYGDPELAKAILSESEAFALKSPALQHRISDDLETLNERILADRARESHLIFSGVHLRVTRHGIQQGERLVPPNEVTGLRWGAIATRDDGALSIAFSFTCRAQRGPEIKVEWTATQNHEAQKELYSKLIDATTSYLLPTLVESIHGALRRAQRVAIGDVVLTKDGIEFQVRGWFSSKVVHCSWSTVESEISSGDVVLSDSRNRKVLARLPILATDNAVALHILVNQGH